MCEDRSPRHPCERVDDESRQRCIRGHAQLAREPLEPVALLPLPQDDESRRPRRSHSRERPEQGGEVLLELELADRQPQRRAAGSDPGMFDGLACPFADRGGVYWIVDDRDPLRRRPCAPGEVVGDSLRVGDDGIGVRVGPADQGAQQGPRGPLALASGGGQVDVDAHHDGDRHVGSCARPQAGEVGGVRRRQHHVGPLCREVARQCREARQHSRAPAARDAGQAGAA